MKLVIKTQIRQTTDQQKIIDSNVYVVENVDQYAGVCQPWVELSDLIAHSNELVGVEEYLTEYDEYSDDTLSWERSDNPIYCTRNGYGLWTATQKTENPNLVDNWIMKKENQREDFRSLASS